MAEVGKSGKRGAVKEILSLDEIKKKLGRIKYKKDEKKEAQQRKAFLKRFLEDKEYRDIKKDLVKLIVPELKRAPAIKYNLVYDSMAEGLEPIYYWILDFMRDKPPGGLDLEVVKGPEEFEASVTSGYFGEMGARATQMQTKAAEYLGAINQVIKSILNLIYDLKEFEIRIEAYDDLHSYDEAKKKAASHSLKAIWMDQVDIKKGKGSINMLAQDLNFVTIRDAFFYVDRVEDVGKLDLNDRVKNILRRKMHEYLVWLDFSEKEIRKRYEIERLYLKSQKGTLMLYANWLKPYLKAAQKLKMKEFRTPDIVNAFSNIQMEIVLFGKKEIKPGQVHESYKDVELDRKYYAVLEVVMTFRGMPSAVTVREGRQYVHAGKAEIMFNAFVMDDIECGAMESMELYEDLDLIEEYVGGSLAQLEEEIDKFLVKPEKEKEEEEKAKRRKPAKPPFKIEIPFKEAMLGFRDVMKGMSKAFMVAKTVSTVAEEETKKAAEAAAKKNCFTIYNTYKKTHGMLSV